MKQYLGQLMTIHIDRPMGSRHPEYGFLHPLNYGYVPNTVSGDGEPIDVYLLGVFESVQVFNGRCIAIIHRLDDDDDKLIIVPKGRYYTDEQIHALTEFQERFFISQIWR